MASLLFSIEDDMIFYLNKLFPRKLCTIKLARYWVSGSGTEKEVERVKLIDRPTTRRTDGPEKLTCNLKVTYTTNRQIMPLKGEENPFPYNN